MASAPTHIRVSGLQFNIDNLERLFVPPPFLRASRLTSPTTVSDLAAVYHVNSSEDVSSSCPRTETRVREGLLGSAGRRGCCCRRCSEILLDEAWQWDTHTHTHTRVHTHASNTSVYQFNVFPLQHTHSQIPPSTPRQTKNSNKQKISMRADSSWTEQQNKEINAGVLTQQSFLHSPLAHNPMCISVCVCLCVCVHRSKSACCSWFGATVFSASVYLWTKRRLWGRWCSTCQSERKDKGARGKGNEVREGGGGEHIVGMVEGFEKRRRDGGGDSRGLER